MQALDTNSPVFPVYPQIPEEISVYIFRYLEITKKAFHERKYNKNKNFLNLRLISKDWSRIVSDPGTFSFWRRIAHSYGIDPSSQTVIFSFLNNQISEKQENEKNWVEAQKYLRGNDKKRAKSCLQNAASRGHFQALTTLNTISCSYDVQEIFGLISVTQIPKCPLPEKIYYLADKYLDDDGFLEKSKLKFFYYNRIAAKLGHYQAQRILMTWYAGDLSKKAFRSLSKSHKWYRLALQNLFEGPKPDMDLFSKELINLTNDFKKIEIELSIKSDTQVNQEESLFEKRKAEEEIPKGQPETKKRRKDPT